MTTTLYTREAGGAPTGSAGGLDLAPLVGDFTCAAGVPGGISRVRIEPAGATVRVRAFGHGDPLPPELTEVTADAIFAKAPDSPAAHALLATVDSGPVCSRLQTYQGFGVFVVHSFHRFAGQRQDYFCREFYVEAGRGVQPRPADPVPAAVPRSGPCDPAGLVGTWLNVNPAATGVAELVCQPAESGLLVRPRAVGDTAAWGEAVPELYADAANPDGPPALLASYDCGFMRVHLQARINRGLLVVAEYAEFTDGSGRSDFMMRECFCR